MAEVVKPWHRLRDPLYDGREDPLPDYGVNCDDCQGPLVGARRERCPHCRAAFDLRSRLPKRNWFNIDRYVCGEMTPAVLQPMLAAEYVPHMPVRDKSVAEIYGGSNIVEVCLTAPLDFYFDVLHLIRAAAKKIDQVRATPRETWRCTGCGSRVPAHFDICWSCEKPRDEHA